MVEKTINAIMKIGGQPHSSIRKSNICYFYRYWLFKDKKSKKSKDFNKVK